MGITITDIKIVGVCSKHVKKENKYFQVPKNKYGEQIPDEDIACIECDILVNQRRNRKNE